MSVDSPFPAGPELQSSASEQLSIKLPRFGCRRLEHCELLLQAKAFKNQTTMGAKEARTPIRNPSLGVFVASAFVPNAHVAG
jgi:hypothetical protein